MNKIVIPVFNENCYFIEHSHKCYIVDPGGEKEHIRHYANTNKLEVQGILLTHGHLDHIGALDCFDVPVYIHENEYELLTNDRMNGFSMFGVPCQYKMSDINIVKINESKTFSLNDKIITVIHTPGHTAGCVCYKMDSNLYSGDTLFKHDVGRWDLPTGNLEMLKASIIKLIDNEKLSTAVHPGHGESTTIGEERSLNRNYKEWTNS